MMGLTSHLSCAYDAFSSYHVFFPSMMGLTMMVLDPGHLVRALLNSPLKIPLVVSVDQNPFVVSVEYFHLVESLEYFNLVESLEYFHIFESLEYFNLVESLEYSHLVESMEYSDLVKSFEYFPPQKHFKFQTQNFKYSGCMIVPCSLFPP